MSERALPVNVGDVVDGRYRIRQLLGRGGMGVVFAAEHLLLKTDVAIKFLTDSDANEAVARFAREAQVTARLTSTHAARVTDIVTPEGRAPYLVMELLRGHDLDATLKLYGPLSVERAVGYVLQACDAIAEAHSAGIVHRDLKPANLFLAQDPHGGAMVKVLDFGLSKLMTNVVPGAANLSTTTTVMGSPAYMSPEQLRSAKRVDERTDVWSLGVVLYELVTGRVPFRFESTAELLIAVASDPYVPAREVRPDLPAALDEIFARCLAKKPEERYPNVVAFARAISRFASASDRALLDGIVKRSAPPVATAIPQVALAVSGTATTLGAVATTQHRQRKFGAAAIGVIGAAVVAGAVLALVQRSQDAIVPAAAASPSIASEPGAISAPPPASRSVVQPALVPPPPASATASASAEPASIAKPIVQSTPKPRPRASTAPPPPPPPSTAPPSKTNLPRFTDQRGL